MWKSAFRQNYRPGYMDEEDRLVAKVGMSKTLEQYKGSTISLHGCGASGAYAAGPDKEEEEEDGHVAGLVVQAEALYHVTWISAHP